MNMVRTLKHSAIVLVFLQMLLSWACSEDRRGSEWVRRSLTAGGQGVAPTVALQPRRLESQEDFDVFEREYRGRLPTETVIAVYDQLARNAQPDKRESDVILMQRRALLKLQSAQDRAGIAGALGDIEALRTLVPDSPHTLYLMARVKEILLTTGSPDNTFSLTAENRDVAVRLREDWRALLAIAPPYKGPESFDAHNTREALTSLTAALKPGGSRTRKKMRGAGSGEGMVADESIARARRVLWRFATGDQGLRLTLCRDRPRSENGSSEVEQTLGLACSIPLKESGPGLDALMSLIASGSIVSPCLWLRRLQSIDPSVGDDARVSALLASMGETASAACLSGSL